MPREKTKLITKTFIPPEPPPRYVNRVVEIDGEWRSVIEYTPEAIASAQAHKREITDMFNGFMRAYTETATGKISMGSYFYKREKMADFWSIIKRKIKKACDEIDKKLWDEIENRP